VGVWQAEAIHLVKFDLSDASKRLAGEAPPAMFDLTGRDFLLSLAGLWWRGCRAATARCAVAANEFFGGPGGRGASASVRHWAFSRSVAKVGKIFWKEFFEASFVNGLHVGLLG
jgi:hypothetical protein